MNYYAYFILAGKQSINVKVLHKETMFVINFDNMPKSFDNIYKIYLFWMVILTKSSKKKIVACSSYPGRSSPLPSAVKSISVIDL